MERENVESFGGVWAYCINGGEKMEEVKSKPIDFVLETVREFGQEDMNLTKQDAGFLEEEETTLYEILDMIWTYGQSTGGFYLGINPVVPEFVTIEWGHRPNELSRYYYHRSEVLVTDGELVFISRFVDSDGNTHHDEYYKYKVLNATFAMIVRYEENNFNNTDSQHLAVYLYGGNERLVKVLRRLNDLLTP
jgi:hypothetical protein